MPFKAPNGLLTMVKIRASCVVVGPEFSPQRFSKISLVKPVDAGEPGALGKVGRYRGKPTPYGHATIEVSDRAETDWSRFDDLLTVLEGCIHALRETGAEDITLMCSLFHDGQCNFAFSPDQLRRIAGLEVELTISCYSAEVE
jgi:hypothetical protein